jgi:hypothetical protein
MLAGIKRTTFWRRLIQTRIELVGLGPGFAETGDLMCVLFGDHALYVLRKKNQSSPLVASRRMTCDIVSFVRRTYGANS